MDTISAWQESKSVQVQDEGLEVEEEVNEEEEEVEEEEEEEQNPELAQGLLTHMEQQYQILPARVRKRIYILGAGNVGKLIAHSLKGLPNPPTVCLLLHRRWLLDAWNKGPQEITINRDGFDIKQTGFEVELLHEAPMQHGKVVQRGNNLLFEQKDKPHIVAQGLPEPQDDATYEQPSKRKAAITYLIVTTKTYFTVSALLPLKYRLSKSSIICLLQNGMGMIDELNEKVFPDPETRPKYVQGINTHGVYSPPGIAIYDPFYAVHSSQGTLALALVTPGPVEKLDETRYLLRTLTRSPVLVAVTQTPTELLLLQLEKLAVNSVINPLTVLLDARNGSILHNFDLIRTIRLLLAETSLVIRSLPELRGFANISNRFSARRLETIVLNLATSTAENISSMLADTRNGRRTEIEYINGYIVRRGEELGIKCLVNYAFMNVVMGKAQMMQLEIKSELPTKDPPSRDLTSGL